MPVRLDEPREQRLLAELDHDGLRRRCRAHVGCVADRDDAVVADEESFGAGTRLVDRDDGAQEQRLGAHADTVLLGTGTREGGAQMADLK